MPKQLNMVSFPGPSPPQLQTMYYDPAQHVNGRGSASTTAVPPSPVASPTVTSIPSIATSTTNGTETDVISVSERASSHTHSSPSSPTLHSKSQVVPDGQPSDTPQSLVSSLYTTMNMPPQAETILLASPHASSAPGSPTKTVITISTGDAVVVSQNQNPNPLSDSEPKPKAIWAIWSRRPTDPSQAPGIIISPCARPPPNVVQQALDVGTPPPSPVLVPKVVEDEGGGEGEEEQVLEKEGNREEERAQVAIGAGAAAQQRRDSIAPSSSASVAGGSTDLTDASTSTVPGSPMSSTTSASLSMAVAVVGNTGEERKITGSETKDEVEGTTPATSTLMTTTIPTTTTTMATTTETTTASAPPIPASASLSPQQPKKSWASLLKTSDSSSSSGLGTGRSGLPISNVVGISIPGSMLSNSSSSGAASVSRKSELLALLNGIGTGAGMGFKGGNYASVAAGPGIKATNTAIRPRGLINSGNMCFATSVLQMLVYTAPFQKLFVELERLRGVGAGREKEREREKEGSKTPLVDAMVEFIREFVVDVSVKEDGMVNGTGWGKGKERERERESGYDDDGMWDGESFIPTYVYDAMKEKKRFDNMRVSFYNMFFIFLRLKNYGLYRVVNKKTQKSFLVSYWRH
ncbi:hypothetical protein AX15_000845 [Amanita polypyramis BW_CC]|nr:hypothetical protein AX15_000845 [Amanita polypyramis BW_CC]